MAKRLAGVTLQSLEKRQSCPNCKVGYFRPPYPRVQPRLTPVALPSGVIFSHSLFIVGVCRIVLSYLYLAILL